MIYENKTLFIPYFEILSYTVVLLVKKLSHRGSLNEAPWARKGKRKHAYNSVPLKVKTLKKIPIGNKGSSNFWLGQCPLTWY